MISNASEDGILTPAPCGDSVVDEMRQTLRSQQYDEQRERRKKLVDDRRSSVPPLKEFEPVPVEEFEALLKDMKKQRINKDYLRKLKNSLCLGDEYINRFIKSNNALELLLSVALRNYDSLCQLEALACLTNLVCGDHKATYRVLRSAGPYVVTFLNGSSPFLQEQAAWFLANATMDCQACRDLLRLQGAGYALVKALQSAHPAVVEMAVLALQAYAQSPTANAEDLIAQGLLKHLCPLFDQKSTKPDFLAHLGWAAFYVYSGCDKERFDDLQGYTTTLCNVTAGKVVQYAAAPTEHAGVLTSLVACLSTWSSGWPELALAVGDTPGMVTTLGHLLQAPFLHLRREALWLVGCLAGMLGERDLSPITNATPGIVPLLNPGAACIEEVVTLLQSIAAVLPAFRRSLSENPAILSQLRQEAVSQRHQKFFRNLLGMLA
ncbi:uncharacterized protein LOC144148110 [Haemaphysalis longicornis]